MTTAQEGQPDPKTQPTPAQVERTVSAIVTSGVLGKSDRRAHLLRYLVDQELSGNGSNIKAFTIAVDVLGRDASFDPNTDSIVRSEIGRLREALRLYFAEMAPSDLPVIAIPKGTYRPVITKPPADMGGPEPVKPAWTRRFVLVAVTCAMLLAAFGLWTLRGPATDTSDRPMSLSDLPYDVVRIVVAPFEAQGNHPDVEKLAFGVYSELPIDLSAYPWISMVTPLSGFENVTEMEADYVLRGTIFWEGETLVGAVQLVSLPEQTVIWTDKKTMPADVMSIESAMIEFATAIAQSLGPLHGIAPALVTAQNARSSEAGLEAFLCFLGMYRYLAEPTDQRHLELRTCLTQAVEENPGYGDGWAALAVIYMDEARFGHNPRGGTPWADAGQAIDQALKFEPLRMPVLIAAVIYSIEGPNRNIDAFERHAHRLIDLFPRHPPTLLTVGSRRAEFVGQWTRGLALIAQAVELQQNPASIFFITAAHKAILGDDDAALMRAVAPLTGETFRTELLLNYIAAARNNLPDRMRDMRALLAARGLPNKADIIAHVRNRRYVAELAAAWEAQLQAAFLLDDGP